LAKAQDLRTYLQKSIASGGKRDQALKLQAKLKEDAKEMREFAKIANEFAEQMEDPKKKTLVLETLTGGKLKALVKIKNNLNESLNRLSCFMISENFERDLLDAAANKMLSSDEAKNFWMQRLKPDQQEYDIEAFTNVFLSLLNQSTKAKLSRDRVLQFVRGVIGE
jgi:hypothetical protein